MKISIVIPVYEMRGKGREFLKKCLDTVRLQMYLDYEVIVTDNSEDGGELRELVYSYDDYKFFYFKSTAVNATQNLNDGIELATGRLIKIMFQDDYFLTNNCLETLVRTFKETGGEWFAFARKQAYSAGGLSQKISPYWNKDIIGKAKNTISAPSVIAFVNRFYKNIEFDPWMRWVFDIDWYYQMYLQYG